MNSRRQTVRYVFYVLLLLTVIRVSAASALAQSQLPGMSPAPQASPTPSLEKRFFKNILGDQRAIWTSPFHLNHGDAKWLAPLGLSTAALLATDRRTASALDDAADNQTRLRISRDISQGGSLYATGGIAATFYFVGRAKQNARARETGLLGAEALVNGELVASALKLISQRPRPRADNGSGEFFDGGRSFPSGHAVSSWSLATVIAYEYGQHCPLVRFGVYGLATAVSLSRYTGRKHFLGDVLVGSAIGYGIGRYVYRTHHDPGLDSPDGQMTRRTQSKLFPLIAPRYNPHAHAYGMTLAWNF
jgi:membrane-associated phospholipid phosphatase